MMMAAALPALESLGKSASESLFPLRRTPPDLPGAAVAPDTITSWELDAFSMGSEQGLQVSPPAEPLTVFKPFFSLLSLPRVAKRQEWIEVSAAVFNYGPDAVVAAPCSRSASPQRIALKVDIPVPAGGFG